MGALLSVFAVGLGARLAASAFSFKAVWDGLPDQRAPQFTAQERQNVPIVENHALPQGRLINKFRMDHFNISYRDPNEQMKVINPKAILPAGFQQAYQRRIGEAFLWITPGGSAPLAKLDPNLQLGNAYPAPQQFLPRANPQPLPVWTDSFLPATQSSGIPSASKQVTGLAQQFSALRQQA